MLRKNLLITFFYNFVSLLFGKQSLNFSVILMMNLAHLPKHDD